MHLSRLWATSPTQAHISSAIACWSTCKFKQPRPKFRERPVLSCGLLQTSKSIFFFASWACNCHETIFVGTVSNRLVARWRLSSLLHAGSCRQWRQCITPCRSHHTMKGLKLLVRAEHTDMCQPGQTALLAWWTVPRLRCFR